MEATLQSTNECNDAYECLGTTISSDYVYCNGYYGCQDAIIDSTYQINFGAYSGASSKIETSNTVYAHGIRCNYDAIIDTSLLLSYGYQSSMYSDINAYNNQLIIFFNGFFSGYFSNVNCKSGETCSIDCGNSFGCYKTSFYCYSGSTCSYNCNYNDESYCPTLYSGIGTTIIDIDSNDNTGTNNDNIKHISMLTDNEINKYKNKQLELKKIQMENDDENDMQFMSLLHDKEGKRESKANDLAVIENDHKSNNNDNTNINNRLNKKKLGNSLFDRINRTGYAPLIYGLFGVFITCSIVLCIKKFEKYEYKIWWYDEDYEILSDKYYPLK